MPQAEIAALSTIATMLEDNNHRNFDGSPTYQAAGRNDAEHLREVIAARRRMRETTPFQPGKIAWALLEDNEHRTALPTRILIIRPDLQWSEYAGEFVDHVIGLVERKRGGWGRMYRHIWRGDITRGYQRARALGLHPE